jgi:hypothetical protein
MNDTSPDIEKKVREMMQQKTPEERLKMGGEMHATSKYLVTCAILRENPQISPADLREELFLKFYGNDFDPAQKASILNHLRSAN